MTVGRPPDFQFPMSIIEIFGKDAENIFGANYMDILKNLAEWERALENRVLSPEIAASYAGALALSTSTPYYPKRGQALKEFHVLLGTAGSSNTVIVINKNGSPVTGATITLASSAVVGSVALNIPWKNSSDVLTFQVTTVGTGAKDLTAIARFV